MEISLETLIGYVLMENLLERGSLVRCLWKNLWRRLFVRCSWKTYSREARWLDVYGRVSGDAYWLGSQGSKCLWLVSNIHIKQNQ